MKISYIDSHTHLYLDAFNEDRDLMIQRAMEAGVTRFLLPNIDSSSIGPMYSLTQSYPGHCLPMMGLHPTSVKQDPLEELKVIESHLEDEQVVAIGETGMDLYWDRSHLKQQEEAFGIQIRWAMDLDLPLVIHARESFAEIFNALEKYGGPGLRGVFHSFTGSVEDLTRALSFDFMIGINGIVTFKNSSLAEVVEEIPLARLLLETDAPFLAPVPFRGKRNESAYLPHVAAKVAEIHNLNLEDIASVTSMNANELFRLEPPHDT